LLGEAVRRLAAAGVRVMARSAIYETSAVSDSPQPDYLNAVIRVSTSFSPRQLLAVGLGIERTMGRVRPVGQSRAARTIDIDVRRATVCEAVDWWCLKTESVRGRDDGPGRFAVPDVDWRPKS